MSNLKSDIDYLKSLAEDGSKGPLRNGSTLFAAGLLYGLAAIAHYAMTVNWIPKSGAMSAFIWLSASVLFAIFATWAGLDRLRVKGSVSNRAAASAWSAVGLGIFSFVACTAVIANIYDTFEPLSYLIAPVILLLYGMGWWVSALMSGQHWLKLVSLGCFVAAPAISFLAGNAAQMLAYAGCLFLFAMVPGWLLMRAAKA